MLESRSAYGYYGEFGGATGENPPPKPHKRGWHFSNFYFEVKGANDKESSRILIRACDYAHAVKQAKAWAKRDNFEILGDAKGYENQVNW